ncbi:MAG: WYL domain-containing protein, partial [Hymenobacteraceae bacterium]|nr:WYL domain-containing protein [Hymenobacteraceae bacterium]
RWFVFGLNEENQSPYWNLALDSIKGITETQRDYQFTAIDWEAYFDDFIGVTRQPDRELELIKLRFAPEQAPYIKTKPLHASQKYVSDTATGLEISIEVIPNYELEKLLLSFGEAVEIVEPKTLRAKIKQRHQQAAIL